MAGRTDAAEALIRVLGKDDVRQLLGAVNADLDRVIAKQAESAKASDAGARSALTLKESWAVMAAGANAALGIVGQVAGAVTGLYDGLKSAAAEDAIARSFRRTFGDGAAALDQMRQSASGLLSDGALRELGTQASRAGLTLEQVNKLVAASTRAAIGSGRDAAELSKEVLKSVSEGTDEAAKQLGLHVDLKAAVDDYARSIGVSVEQLTSAQRVSASLEETTRAIETGFGVVTGTEFAARFTALESRWTNLTASAKQYALEAGFALVDKVTGAERERELADTGLTQANALRAAIVRGRDAFLELKTAFADDITIQVVANSIEQTAQYEYMLSTLQASLDLTGEKVSAVDFVLRELGTDPENIERAARELRSMGDAAGALALQERAVQKAREDSAKALADRAEQERQHALAVQQARQAMEQSLRDEDSAARAAVQSALAQARTAESLGLTTVAAHRYADAMRLADQAGVSLGDTTAQLAIAAKSHGNELIRTMGLELEAARVTAALAAARFDLAAAFEAQAKADQIAGQLAEFMNPRKAAPAARGGTRRRLTDELQPETVKSVSDAYASARDTMSIGDKANADLEAIQRADREAASQQQLAAALAQHQAQIDSQRQAFDDAGAAGDRFADSLRSLAGVDLGPLGASVSQLGPLIESIQALNDETNKTKGNMGGAVAGIVGASGKIAAGLIQNETAKAAVMALVESAAGFSSLAYFDYMGAGLHFASAGVYATVAGMSAAKSGGGGGSRGGGATSRGPSLPAAMQQPATQSKPEPPISYNVYMSGSTIVGGNEQQLGRDMTRVLADADRRRMSSGPSRGAAPR